MVLVKCVRLLRSPEPCENLRSEAGYGAKRLSVRECRQRIIIGAGVPGELVAPRPSAVGWPCRNKQPAAGSTPPRPRCSPAGLQVERQPLPLWPEGPLDLQGIKIIEKKISLYSQEAQGQV